MRTPPRAGQRGSIPGRIALLALACVALASAAAWLAPLGWPFELFVHFRPQYGVAAALVAFPFLLFARGFFVFLIIIFLAPAVAELVLRIADRFTKTKRGRSMQVAVGVGFALGTLPWLLLSLNLFLLLFAILVIVTAVTRLR